MAVDADIFKPTRTIADMIREHQGQVASPGASTVQQGCAIPTGQAEVTGTTVTVRRSEERTVTEQVTRPVQPDVLPRLGSGVIIADYQGEIAGAEWGQAISPTGRTRVTQEGALTPSPTAKTGTVTPTPTGTPVADSPADSAGARRTLRKRKEPVEKGTITISESDSETYASSPVGTAGTGTRTPTTGTPPAHMLPKSPNSPKNRIVTRLSLEAQAKESKAERSARRQAERAARAGGSEPRMTRSKEKDREQESHKKTKMG